MKYSAFGTYVRGCIQNTPDLSFTAVSLELPKKNDPSKKGVARGTFNALCRNDQWTEAQLDYLEKTAGVERTKLNREPKVTAEAFAEELVEIEQVFIRADTLLSKEQHRMLITELFEEFQKTNGNVSESFRRSLIARVLLQNTQTPMRQNPGE